MRFAKKPKTRRDDSIVGSRVETDLDFASIACRRLAAGHFNLRPTDYEIYTLQSPEHRAKLDVSNRRQFGGTGCKSGIFPIA